MRHTNRKPRRTPMGDESLGGEMDDALDSRHGNGNDVGPETDAGKLAKENARLEEELRREHERYLRALADFDNYRKRVDRESGRVAQAGKREVILSLLNVLDDFERAYEHVEDSPASVLEGLRVIHRRLKEVVAAQGVTPFESVGQPFDPEWHEAVGTIESDEQEEGRVVEEVNRGYRWGEDLLRPARVRVAR